MSDYKCEVCGDVVEKTGVTIRYIEDKGVIHDVQCEKCGEYMELANPKKGFPSFGSDRWGGVR